MLVIFPLTNKFFGKNSYQPYGLVYDCYKCHKIRDKTLPSYGKHGYDKFNKPDRYNRYKYNAKERGYTWDITEEEFGELWKKPCYYCKTPISTIGLDRIDNLSKNEIIKNITRK